VTTISNEALAELLYDAAWAAIEEEPPVAWPALTDRQQIAGYRGQAAALVALLDTSGYQITDALETAKKAQR
jgi:hypothetical protein